MHLGALNGINGKLVVQSEVSVSKKPTSRRKVKSSEEENKSETAEDDDSVERVLVTEQELRELTKSGQLRPGVAYVTERMMVAASRLKSVADPPAAAPKTALELRREKEAREAKLSARARTGLSFVDEDGEYDVPVVPEPMWFWLGVRKNSERKVCDAVKDLHDSHPRFKGKIVTAFHPQAVSIKMKGTGLACEFKPMIPGLVYIKTCMGPEIADVIESIPGVKYLTKNRDGLVVPLPAVDAVRLERTITLQVTDLREELKLLKKDEYVSVVSGPHKGEYGIFNSVKSGMVEVILRKENVADDMALINAEDLRYLANPPEKKWTEMTAREAVESLISKDRDGKNPTLRALRDQGLLQEILYGTENPEALTYLEAIEERERKNREFKERKEMRARGGGMAEFSPGSDRRIRSIASNAKTDGGPMRVWEPKKKAGASYSDPFAAEKAWGRDGGSGASSSSSSSASQKDGDFDSFIQDLLDDLDGNSSLDGQQQQTKASGRGSNKNVDFDDEDLLGGGGDTGEMLDRLLQDLDRSRDKSSAPVPAASTKGNDVALSMQDFDSFEAYLAALVKKEDSSGGGRKSNSKSAPPKAARVATTTTTTAAAAAAAATPAATPAPATDSMTVPQLKEALRQRGLPVSGTKGDLLARLRET